MDQAFTRIGKRFDELAEQNSLSMDQNLTDDVASAVRDYADLGPPVEKANALRAIIDRVGSGIDKAGNISGEAYKSLRSSIERAARGASDPDYASVLRDVKNALDDAMERSMTAARSPDVGEWIKIREQYRNILVIENALARTSKEAAAGLITPEALRGSIKNIYGKRNMVRGQGPFEELSRAATTLMTDLPQTGFAPMNAATIWQSGLAAPVEALIRLGRDLRMTKPAQKWLTNRAMPPPSGVSDLARGAVPAAATLANIQRDRNGVPILDQRGQPIPLR
jgi:hypothetical protein